MAYFHMHLRKGSGESIFLYKGESDKVNPVLHFITE